MRLRRAESGKGKDLPRKGHEGLERLDGDGWLTLRSGCFTLGKGTWYPLYRRLGGPQGRSGWVRKISPSTGIRSPEPPARSGSLYRRRHPALRVGYLEFGRKCAVNSSKEQNPKWCNSVSSTVSTSYDYGSAEYSLRRVWFVVVPRSLFEILHFVFDHDHLKVVKYNIHNMTKFLVTLAMKSYSILQYMHSKYRDEVSCLCDVALSALWREREREWGKV